MTSVTEAVAARYSCRAFQDKTVDPGIIRGILTRATQAPSGGNLQPWRLWVTTGATLQRIKAEVTAKLPTHPRGEGPEYQIYPPKLPAPYRDRRYACGEGLYGALNIPRDNKIGRLLHFARNYQAFGAPVLLFFAQDRIMQEGQWADLGMYMQTVMLLAAEQGLATCAQEAWAIWPQTVGEIIGIPDTHMLFCGMTIGYEDAEAPVNDWRTERASLEEIATFLE